MSSVLPEPKPLHALEQRQQRDFKAQHHIFEVLSYQAPKTLGSPVGAALLLSCPGILPPWASEVGLD